MAFASMMISALIALPLAVVAALTGVVSPLGAIGIYVILGLTFMLVTITTLLLRYSIPRHIEVMVKPFRLQSSDQSAHP